MVKKEVHPEIGNRIRMLRERKGIDQLQLAEKLGYKSQSTISKWESGTNLPTGKKLIELAQILGTSTNEILGMVEPLPEPAYTETDLRKMAENAKTFDGKPLNENDIQAIQNIIEIYLQGRPRTNLWSLTNFIDW
jgi:transcriptional regulator, XRE family